MKIIFLGTNGWYNTVTGETSCILIDSQKAYVVLDAGSGFSQLDKYIKEKKPIYVFLSHWHLDHSIGLHALAKFKFPQGIKIFAHSGSKKIFQTLVNSPFTANLRYLRSLGCSVKFFELKTGKHNWPLPLECRYLEHVTPCLGCRLTLENKIITYCTDTGICSNLTYLAQRADILITECALKKENKENKESTWPHLWPQGAAKLAKKVQAKKLILTHFDAVNYPSKKDRIWAQREARQVFKNTFAAFDEKIFSL